MDATCFGSRNSRDLKLGWVQETISRQAFGESSSAANEAPILTPQMANTKKTAAHTSRLPPASIQISPVHSEMAESHAVEPGHVHDWQAAN